ARRGGRKEPPRGARGRGSRRSSRTCRGADTPRRGPPARASGALPGSAFVRYRAAASAGARRSRRRGAARGRRSCRGSRRRHGRRGTPSRAARGLPPCPSPVPRRYITHISGTTQPMPSSLEIAQRAVLRPVDDLAADLGLIPEEVDLYGKYKAKIDLSVLDRLAGQADAKLIDVTAITPTKAGEGKTTTSASLTEALGHIS